VYKLAAELTVYRVPTPPQFIETEQQKNNQDGKSKGHLEYCTLHRAMALDKLSVRLKVASDVNLQ
jgi:hypothetical protein